MGGGALSYSLCFCLFPPEMVDTNTKQAASIWSSLFEALPLIFVQQKLHSQHVTLLWQFCYCTVRTLYLKSQYFFSPGEHFQWCDDVWSWAQAKNMPPKSSTPKNCLREVSQFLQMFWNILNVFSLQYNGWVLIVGTILQLISVN